MRKLLALLVLMGLACGPLTGCEVSCRADSDAGDKIEDAAEDIGDAVEDATN